MVAKCVLALYVLYIQISKLILPKKNFICKLIIDHLVYLDQMSFHFYNNFID